jgi:tRNA A-37 threonylcarbamoyl transferase component Bud32
MEDLIIDKDLLDKLKKDLPDLFHSSIEFKSKKVPSKKNSVFDIEFIEKPRNYPKELILKIFSTDNLQNEYNTLQKLNTQKLEVPEVYFRGENYILIEKIYGKNLCDLINDSLKVNKHISELNSSITLLLISAIKSLANWFSTLHIKNIHYEKNEVQFTVLNKGDARLRDFIFNSSSDMVYGVDFEESYIGSHMDDLGWVCCSLLDTNPGIFQNEIPKHKIDLVILFLNTYYDSNKEFNFSLNYFAQKLIEYINIVIERRSLNIGTLNVDAVINKLSKSF